MNARLSTRRFAILCAFVMMTAPSSRAAMLSIVNPSFEQNAASPGSFPVLIPAGWSLVDSAGIVDQSADAVGVVNPTGTTFFTGGVPDGNNAALVYLSGDIGGGIVGLSQTLTSSLEAGVTYNLSVGVGNIASGFGAPPFDQFFDLDGFPGYRVELLAGTTLLAADANQLGASIPEGQFRTSQLSVFIPAGHPAIGQPLEIRLLNLNLAGTPEVPGIEVDFDNVRLEVTAVPEPAAALGGATVALLFAVGRKLRRYCQRGRG